MGEMVQMIPKMLTLKEASEKTGISYSGLRQLCMKKAIPHVRSGRKYYINELKLVEYLNTAGLAG